MRRPFAVLLAALLVFFACSFAFGETDEVTINGGFEDLSVTGEAEGWYAAAYRTQPGYSRMLLTDERAHSGRYSIMIENASSNDARYTRTVKVEPKSLYRLSGYVLVDHMEDLGNGANFALEGIYSVSECLFDTNGTWKHLEWYGETGPKQTELTLGVRVGGYSAESVGKAYFDDIKLEKVEELPDDVIASLWYDAGGAPAAKDDTSSQPQKKTVLLIVLAVLFIFAATTVMPMLTQEQKSSRPVFALAVLLVFALVVRVVLAMRIPGYEVDINCFTAWSMRMASVGPADFYAPDYFCDYPPGAMLLLWPFGLLLHAVGLQNAGGALLVVKGLPILCDLLGAVALYQLCIKRIGSLPALVLCALYLLNPATLVNGAGWGQVDSVLALLILLCTGAAVACDWKKAIPLFVVSALVKPQALLFAPIGGLWLVADWRKSKSQRTDKNRQIAAGAAVAALCALLIVLPFSIHQEFGWLVELYRKTLSSYAYATLNTANLYYLFGANWAPLQQTAPLQMLAFVFAVFLASAVLTLRDRSERSQKTVPALFFAASGAIVILWLAGGTYAAFGYTMMAFAYLFAILCMQKKHRQNPLPFVMALALMGVYVLGVKVHERYLFPALLLLLYSYALSRDRRVLLLMAGFSATTFINTGIVLDNAILFGSAQGHLNTDTLVLNQILCVCNFLLLCYGGWLGYAGLRESAALKPIFFREKQPASETSYAKMLLNPADPRLHLKARDVLLMAAVTFGYAALTFSHLGSTVAPQTAWVSTSDKEEVVLALEKPATFSLLYYAGVSYHDFSYSVSDDGMNWSEPNPCEMREGLCYRWLYALEPSYNEGSISYPTQHPSNVLWLDGQYIRIQAEQAGLNLWEVVARDEAGNNLPLTLVSHAGANAELLTESKPASHLIDEMDTCRGEPSWYNGTYFDEIYHARTAYEHLHWQAPYETTHPPLGKLMMSASIALFGMTPFGWRFAGALAGVLMLPALYLLALQLTHKKRIAAISMIAFALDLMHFAQTRIATIDSFPVLFILLSLLLMVRYMQTDVFAVSHPDQPKLLDRAFTKGLVPLLFSGICMGLSIASKWIGLYSAVGLAVLFFLTVYRQYRVSCVAWDLDIQGVSCTPDQRSRIKNAQELTLKRILVTCGFCVCFFVVIPALIYYLSYIPYLAPTGPASISRVIKAQQGMLSYHSTPGLGMDHPFQSPWWQWPFILKPIWFSQDQFEPAGYASTIMCIGNPWVFYVGALAMVAVLLALAAKYVRVSRNGIRLCAGDGNLVLVVVVVGFLAQYLPWVLVPRSMYIYHYFASVPFIIMATAWLLEQIPAERPGLRRWVMAAYLAAAAVFFVLFFPYASGYLTSTRWLDAMKWFSRLYY